MKLSYLGMLRWFQGMWDVGVGRERKGEGRGEDRDRERESAGSILERGK